MTLQIFLWRVVPVALHDPANLSLVSARHLSLVHDKAREAVLPTIFSVFRVLLVNGANDYNPCISKVSSLTIAHIGSAPSLSSVSSTSGGCFGRVEAYFGSKECQKSGTCPSLTLFKHDCGDTVEKNSIRKHNCKEHSNKRVKGTLMKCRNDTTNDLEQIKMRNFSKHWICAKCSCEIHYNDIVDHQKLCFQDDTAS